MSSLVLFIWYDGQMTADSINIILGRGGVLGQGKVSGSWVKKRFMGTLAVTGYGSG